jgi:hypothetical protein
MPDETGQFIDEDVIDEPKTNDDKPMEDSETDQLLAKLDSFGESLAKTRSEAIASRLASGIEHIWLEDEEYYEGIDEVNRSETRSAWRQKPVGQGNISARKRKKKNRSTIFPNITAQFVDSAAARIADMLLPTDDRSWSLKPTPIPETLKMSKLDVRDETASLQSSDLPNVFPLAAGRPTSGDVKAAKMEIKAAIDKANAAQTQIEDWHNECQWHAEVRTVIENASRIGVGVLKGPVPFARSQPRWIPGEDGEPGKMILDVTTNPGSKSVDPWNLFPDGGCGDNIHNGSYIWERDYVTKKQLRDLMAVQGYNEIQILKCLEEGPQIASANTKKNPDPVADPNYMNKFEIWYYHGTAEKDDMIAGGCDCEDEKDPHLNVMITMVNDHVIRASMNPLVTGDYPYDVMPWRRQAGHWAGIGISRQIRPAQKIVTGATRNLMDNAGLAAGPMIIFKQGVVTPADKVAGIGPRKVFYIAEDSDITDATKAIGVVTVPMLVNDLLAIVEHGMSVAENTTGLPMLLQGQQGAATHTVGGMTMLDNNANSVLRRLARLFDDKITEPHIRRYYKWLLTNTEDDKLKGDYLIDARGSTALLERDIQNQEMPQLLEFSQNPVYGIDPKKTVLQFLKSKRFVPKDFEYDDEEWQQLVKQLSQPPEEKDTSLEVANLRAQSEQMKEQSKHALLDAKHQHEAGQNDLDREIKLMVEAMHQEIDATLEGAKQQGMDKRQIEELKGKLTDTLMKLDVQKQLSGTVALKPAVEPAGRAEPGKSFSQ